MPTLNNPNSTLNTEPEDIFATEDISQPLATPQISPEAYQAATQQPAYEVARTGRGLSRTMRIVLIALIGVVGLSAIAGLIWLLFNLTSRPATEIPAENEVIDQPTEQPEVVVPENPTNETPIEEPTEEPTDQPTEQPSGGDFTDSDFDGLSDAEEREYNTNPLKRDTDADGLSDREEVRVYTTDPRNPDTDGDTYNDGAEVTNFYDPLDGDSTKRLFDL